MILTEDKLIDFVESQGGVLITRRTLNISTINFDKCKENTLVCLTGYNKIISDFFNVIINKFTKPVILIIIESDVIHLEKSWLNNKKLTHCFTWNKPFHHSKLSGLPIGLNYNRQYDILNTWLTREKEIEQIPKFREKLLCMNCSLYTNPARSKLMEKIKSEWNDFCTIIDFIPNISSHYIPSHIEGKIRIDVTNPLCYDEWKKYKFVLSPPGAGIDCHRTWEAVHTGCIPIVLSSNLNELYSDLPIVVVKSWDEITPAFLEDQYQQYQENKQNNTYNYDKLTLEYWTNKIINTKEDEEVIVPKIHFITYANERFALAKERLLEEAKEFGEFATIKGYGPEDLPQNFCEKYKEILKQPRGGGYWIWRPLIIYNALKNLNENDYLIYLDAGCKLNIHGKKRFHEYIDLLDKSDYGIMSFQMSGNTGPGGLEIEKKWTIKEIFEHLNVDMNSDIANSGQYLGGVLVMKKNEHLDNYMKVFVSTILTKPLLCTDVYNNNNNQIREFRENRHEQSITSILRKKMGSVVIDGDESWMCPFGQGESLKYPFWATRSKH